jgi:hypothetical protein
MLRTASPLKGIAIEATDGEIGSVQDLYFDDGTWTIRYAVVDTGTWLPGRQVLLSPMSFQALRGGRLFVSLTRAQVEQSPPIDTDRPVERQHEMDLATHYGHDPYWSGPYRWGLVGYPGAAVPSTEPAHVDEEVLARDRETADPHLRSVREVTGYYIQATDGALGHVEEFLLDDEIWAMRYMVVDTRNWWPGRRVLVSPDWIDRVSWSESTVHVELSRSQIETAPEYDPERPFTRQHERLLYERIGRPSYWDREARR